MWELDYKESWGLKNWCFWTVVLEKTLESLRVWVNSGSWWWTGRPGNGQGGLLPWNCRVRHNWVTELNWTESRNWCLQIVVLEKTLESSLESKVMPVNSKGNQTWVFIGRTDADIEAPILWPPDVKSWLIEKDPDFKKTEGRKRRGWQSMKWLDDISDSMDMSLSKLQDIVKERDAWCAVVHGVTKSQIQLSDWTATSVD